jgi:integrase
VNPTPEPGAELVPIGPPATLKAGSTLAALEAAAEQHIADTIEDNTRRAYASAWRVWQQYCRQLGIPETSNTRGALVGFVVWLQDKPPTDEELRLNPDAPNKPQAPATIDARLAGAVVGLSRLGHEPDRQARQDARQALTAYRKRLAKERVKLGRGKAPAAKVEHLRNIGAAAPDTLAGRRDRALALVGFRFASRSAELACLAMSDIEDVGAKGIVVNVPFGKTGGRRVPIPMAKDPAICPVVAWREWCDAANYTDGPAFAQISKADRLRRDQNGRPLPLGPRGIREVIARAGKRAGVDVHLTGHSLRAGLATEARRAGHDNKTISDITGHTPTSAVLYGYFREVDEWNGAPDDIL